MFCMVPPGNVVSVYDVNNIYQVPGLMLEKRVPALVMEVLRINKMTPELMPRWIKLARRAEDYEKQVTIAIVGKYTGSQDTYLSVLRALGHAAAACDLRLVLNWVESQILEPDNKVAKADKYAAAWDVLKTADGILIPGGFGDRGVLGKILACQYAREQKKPYFGICLGLQIAVIEHCRHVLHWETANSTEFDAETEHPCVVFMPEGSRSEMGGTMRLGSRKSVIAAGSLAHQVYSYQADVMERHRHRYEVNPDMVAQIEAAGLLVSAKDEDGQRMEMVELATASHPFFFAVQFHPGTVFLVVFLFSRIFTRSSARFTAYHGMYVFVGKLIICNLWLVVSEFKSRPTRPSPPFLSFVQASAGLFVRKTDQPSSRPSTPRSMALSSAPSSGAHDPSRGFVPIAAAGAAAAGDDAGEPPARKRKV